MRKLKIILVSLLVIAAIIGFVTGGISNDLTGMVSFDDSKRVLITPHNAKATKVIKGLVDIKHNFGNKFSAELSLKVRSKISSLADIEEIGKLSITGRATCGDSIIHPSEECGEPTLSNCDLGSICDACKCRNASVQQRTCTPKITNYGVAMLNGGNGGMATVTVIDTGVNVNHPDLNIKVCKDATQKGIRNGCDDWHGHGTHVSGIVAANGGYDGKGLIGMAPNAPLWHIRVCNSRGWCWADDIAEAIRFAANRGTDIISMSLGGDYESTLIKEAIQYATSKGVLMIAAAGNDGPGFGSIDYPAAHKEVVAVGAIDSAKNVAFWSSRGVNNGDYVIDDREVELSAPGVSVYSTWRNGCYTYMSGTSMATPQIAGLASKLWQGNAADTRTYLQNLAKQNDILPKGDDPASGFGLPIAP